MAAAAAEGGEAQGGEAEVGDVCTLCKDEGAVEILGTCPLCEGLGSATWMKELEEAAEGREDLAYEEVDIPGKGRGIISARRIEKGGLILAELPLIVVEGVEGVRKMVAAENQALAESMDTLDMRRENELSAHDPRLARAVSRALARLPLSEQDAFLSLANGFDEGQGLQPGTWVEVLPAEDSADECKGRGLVVKVCDASTFPGDFVVEVPGKVRLPGHRLRALGNGTIGGTLLTNAVSADGEDASYVYGKTSRINHSCTPNAEAVKAGTVRCIVASGSIEKGQEICITYSDSGMQNAAFREKVRNVATSLRLDGELLLLGLYRQQLFAKWGFYCSCPRCTPLAEGAEQAVAAWCAAFQL